MIITENHSEYNYYFGCEGTDFQNVVSTVKIMQHQVKCVDDIGGSKHGLSQVIT
jgi:hypothetical protein